MSDIKPCPFCGHVGLEFGDTTNSAPFPSAVVIFRPREFALVAYDAPA